jgi:NAD(P)-dependent dehydrogenase (short-subunit alcohol dehydrogenase family)
MGAAMAGAPIYSVPGKVALVTGAQRGIGWETARILHSRGASVALVDLDEDAAKEAAERIAGDGRVLGIGADVTDRDAIQAAVEETVEAFGGLDVVVANAGVAPPTATMRVIDEDAFERTVEIDLLGVWRTVRAALPPIVERRGHVVVVASVYAFFNGVLNASYAMSKAGVEQLGRALRVELAQHGASASVAYFGFIDTRMVQDAFEDPIARHLEESQPKWMLRRLPPSAAGEAIVSGIERRAPRIIAPRWWAIWSVLRGLLNPLFDARAERDARLQEAVRMGDAPERAQVKQGTAPPAP